MSTPKIIHFLWLNFKNNSNGILDNKINFFIKRICDLHKSYTINFINKWDQCISSIDEEHNWIIKIITNKFIGPAHKSDVLRFYYLYTMGGVWVDISTYFVVNVDDLVTNNNNGFTCFYAPIDLCQSWMLQPFSILYDMVDIENYLKSIDLIKNVVKQKYDFLQIIPENYFIIASKNNSICCVILNMFKMFYETYSFDSYDDVNNSNNKYMLCLMNNIFNNDSGLILQINNQLKNFHFNNEEKYLNTIFGGSYLFNYLMMYIAIANYCIKNNHTKIVSQKNETRTKQETKLINHYNSFCSKDSCCDKVIYFNDNSININCLSSSYYRLSKWNNNFLKRISWEDTLAGEIIKKSINLNKIVEELSSKDIRQLKFGSWTRKSSVITKLMEVSNS